MVLLDKLWDDIVAGPQPDRGLGKLRKLSTPTLNVRELGESSGGKPVAMPVSPGTPAMPVSPGTPATPTTPGSARKENVWRNVFHPGSNLATKTIGGHYFDKPQPNSPTVYDWLYSDETRSKHR